jgi:hypothetical protein
MINSTTSTARTAHAETVITKGQPIAKPAQARTDLLSTDNAAFLRSELSRQPEIRPEVVVRARALAADPGYPSRDTLKKVAGVMLASPDLSEDQS